MAATNRNEWLDGFVPSRVCAVETGLPPGVGLEWGIQTEVHWLQRPWMGVVPILVLN